MERVGQPSVTKLLLPEALQRCGMKNLWVYSCKTLPEWLTLVAIGPGGKQMSKPSTSVSRNGTMLPSLVTNSADSPSQSVTIVVSSAGALHVKDFVAYWGSGGKNQNHKDKGKSQIYGSLVCLSGTQTDTLLCGSCCLNWLYLYRYTPTWKRPVNFCCRG